MKRKGKLIKAYPYQEFDIRNDIEESRLAAIGAVSLSWNDLEGAIDTALPLALELEYPLWTKVTSRINGFDGKIALLKEAMELELKFPEDKRRIVCATLGSIEEHKKYRDALIHAKILHPAATVAPSVERRGEIIETLVSEDAINALYERLTVIRAEFDEVVLIFSNTAIIRERISRHHSEDDKQKALKELPACFSRLQHLQKKRKALPPLPKFPVELLNPQSR